MVYWNVTIYDRKTKEIREQLEGWFTQLELLPEVNSIMERIGEKKLTMTDIQQLCSVYVSSKKTTLLREWINIQKVKVKKALVEGKLVYLKLDDEGNVIGDNVSPSRTSSQRAQIENVQMPEIENLSIQHSSKKTTIPCN